MITRTPGRGTKPPVPPTRPEGILENQLQPVIGLEVHVQLGTLTKLFCRCPAAYGGEPNSRTCPVCLGLPGALPFPNREAVRLAVRFAQALDCTVHPVSVWARKNYFYPDLPKGYQISQFDRPLATSGRVRIEPNGRAPRFIHVVRVHLEEDAGKSIHEGFGEGTSGIDLNRCGVPLVEVVSAPELETPEDAYLYLERLRSLLLYTAVSEAEMEKGSLRCDANVSVHRPGEPWGQRVEIKNLNSFRHVRRALAHEIERQTAVIEAGGVVEQETRLWDEGAGITRPMRSKEEAQDYRYFPEPDLPPLELDPSLIDEAGGKKRELPHTRRDRFMTGMGLPETDAHRLTLDPDLADFFEETAGGCGNPRAAANWVLSELLGALNQARLPLSRSKVTPPRLAFLIGLLDRGTISGKSAKEVFAAVFESGCDPQQIIAERGLAQISDAASLEKLCAEVVAANPDKVDGFRRGKTGLLGFFVGQVMARSEGRADPAQVNEILRRLLE